MRTVVRKLVLVLMALCLVVPVRLWGAFQAGVPKPYSDPALEEFLSKSGVALIRPKQHLDKWRLDLKGVRPVPNEVAKQSLGFAKG